MKFFVVQFISSVFLSRFFGVFWLDSNDLRLQSFYTWSLDRNYSQRYPHFHSDWLWNIHEYDYVSSLNRILVWKVCVVDVDKRSTKLSTAPTVNELKEDVGKYENQLDEKKKKRKSRTTSNKRIDIRGRAWWTPTVRDSILSRVSITKRIKDKHESQSHRQLMPCRVVITTLSARMTNQCQ